ncbi:MAG: bifunctional glycosyltransferase family 2/GtrA family protein [Clostridia bacterium]|nr:bifunctional glycosyltransferase family 2/GtrA family protein [Clostridia bacterium]
MIVVIPAYQPDEKLVKLVNELKEKTAYPIVVVNDGSRAETKPVFDAIAPLCTVLTHEVNRGKGAAMKTAFRYIQENFPQDEGVVTVDADGQHLVKDIIRVSEDWAQHRDSLVLGSRRFTGKVPFRSLFGNSVTRAVFHLSTGTKVYDTQTGLRAFSVDRIPLMLEMKGDRYEYEINVLLYATRRDLPIREVWIDTVYIEDNASSHFKLRDAWRIYKMILMFAASSLVSFLIEYILFLLLRFFFPAQNLLLAVVIVRVISSYVNYRMNRSLVFEAKTKHGFWRYYVLALASLFANYGLILLFSVVIPLPEAIAKLIADLSLYPVNFWVQRVWVFKEDK